jgi:hypothetical protein
MGSVDCVSVGMLFSSQPDYFHGINMFQFDLFYVVFCYNKEKEVEDKNTSVVTSKIDGEISLKPNRPAIVVSSTSWYVLLD